MTRVIKYFAEAREELKKVAWPTRATTIRYSVFVVVLCAALALYFGLLDWALTLGFERLIGIFG